MSIDTTIDEQAICDKCNQVMNYMGVLHHAWIIHPCNQVMNYMGVLSNHDVWKCFVCVIVKEVMIK